MAAAIPACAIGEVLGVVIGTALGWSNGATIAASIVLAFFFGHALTSLPLLASQPVTVRIEITPDALDCRGPPDSLERSGGR